MSGKRNTGAGPSGGSDSPPAGAVPLRDLLWCVSEVTDAFANRFDLGDSSFGEKPIRNDAQRSMTLEWPMIISERSGRGASWEQTASVKISGVDATCKDPFKGEDEADEEGYYKPHVDLSGCWKVWDPLARFGLKGAWARAYAAFLVKICDGTLLAYGQVGSCFNPFRPIPRHLWPDGAHDERLNFQAGKLTVSSGETVHEICIVRLDASPSESNSSAETQKPAMAKSKGRPPSPEKSSAVAWGLMLMKKRGSFATNQPEWDCQARLEEALASHMDALENPKSPSTIRGWAKEIIHKYQQGQ